jgi:hypothetical protein
MRCEREIVWEIFFKKIGETIKKSGKKILGEIVRRKF